MQCVAVCCSVLQCVAVSCRRKIDLKSHKFDGKCQIFHHKRHANDSMTLQHTATYCSTHECCNARQHTTTRYNILQHTAVLLSDLPSRATNSPQHTAHDTATHCNTMQHTVRHCTTHCTTLHNITLHNILHTLQHTATLLGDMTSRAMDSLQHPAQHTGTHCTAHCITFHIILQHTATHYNTLQHTATYCSTHE